MVAAHHYQDGSTCLLHYFLLALLGSGVFSVWIHSNIDGNQVDPNQLFKSQHFSVTRSASQLQPEHAKEEVRGDRPAELFEVRNLSATKQNVRKNHDAEPKETEARDDKQHQEEMLQAHEEHFQKNGSRADDDKSKEQSNKKNGSKDGGHKLRTDLEHKVAAATAKTKSKDPLKDERARAKDGQALLKDQKGKVKVLESVEQGKALNEKENQKAEATKSKSKEQEAKPLKKKIS